MLSRFWTSLCIDWVTCVFLYPRPPPAPSQAPVKIMWNTSNSKVILRWDQVHALENESEVTGYKVKKNTQKTGFTPPLKSVELATAQANEWFHRL